MDTQYLDFPIHKKSLMEGLSGLPLSGITIQCRLDHPV